MSYRLGIGQIHGIPQILVVDDDPAILQLVQDTLVYGGFGVLSALSGDRALGLIEREGLPDLAVLDVMMPGMDGFTLARQMLTYSDLPIIMLGALDEEQTIVRAIDSFAEDYIVKPFRPRELIARVNRVLRRFGPPVYTRGPLVRVDEELSVSFVRREAYVRGRTIPLTPTETKLLYILMRNAGHTVSADLLVRRLWPLEEVFEDALRVHIRRLRQKIEPDAARPRYIVTQRGTGYCFLEE